MLYILERLAAGLLREVLAVRSLLWTLPLVGALLGWATNWLAVRMLFRPRRAIKVLGFTIWGLLPKRRTELAAKIASTVERELVRPEDVKRLFENPILMERAGEEIDRRVREFLAHKMNELPTLALLVLPADLEERLRKSIVKHALQALPEISSKFGEELAQRLDVRRLVEERVKAFDAERLERIVLEIARRELRWIEILGGLIGAVVGGLQWALMGLLG